VAEPAPLQFPALAQRLCDRCLGRRLIGAAGVGPQREAAAKARTWPEAKEADCPVCEGAFAEADQWVRAAKEAAAVFEFQTFQVGTKFPGPCEGFERDAAAAMGQEKLGESIRTEANRMLAARLAAELGKSAVTEARPDIVIDVDTRYWSATAQANSVFVRGRYNKLRRDIPQTHWPCRRCQGRGCWECGDTGVTYKESVEEAIGEEAQPIFGASAYAFHGAGREDIDALMLGTGRPFVLELMGPHRRSVDLAELERRVNAATATTGVSIRDLRVASKEEVAAIKEGEYGKEYVAHCLAATPLARTAVEDACRRLTGAVLEQRTPDRVAHRRADLVRRRTIHAATLEAMPEDPGTRFSVRVRAESGTYIKEMVSGDEGRTVPSFSSLAGVPTKVEFLDVVAILDDAPRPDPSPPGPASL
jgi:tRNA pseudouridine synthase 10